jgi:hypothetical protein
MDAKQNVWVSWPGGIGWPTPIPLKGGANSMAGSTLPNGFKMTNTGVVAPPVTVFNGGKRKASKKTRKGRKASKKTRKARKATRKH